VPKWLPYALAAGAAWWFFFRKKGPGGEDEPPKRPERVNRDGASTRGFASEFPQKDPNATPAEELTDLEQFGFQIRNFVPSTAPRMEAARPYDSVNTCNNYRMLWDPEIEPGNEHDLVDVRAIKDGTADSYSITYFYGGDSQIFAGLKCVSHPDIALFASSKDDGEWFALDYGRGVVIKDPRSLYWVWDQTTTGTSERLSACRVSWRGSPLICDCNDDPDCACQWQDCERPGGCLAWEAIYPFFHDVPGSSSNPAWSYVIPDHAPADFAGPVQFPDRGGKMRRPLWARSGTPGEPLPLPLGRSAQGLEARRFQTPQQRAAEGAGLGEDAGMGPWRAGGPARGGRRRTAEEARERALATYGSPTYEQRRF